MQEKKKNYLLWIVFMVVLLCGSLFFSYYFIKNLENPIDNKSIAEMLFGPFKETRAKELSPDKVIYWTNYYRKENGLSELTRNSLLTLAAQEKTYDMIEKQYFEHVSPDGIKPADLVAKTGYSYKTTGENLALGDFLDEKELVDAWMNSPGHRANILNSEFTEIGVASGLGKYQDRAQTWFAVQEFGKPLPNCSKPSETTKSEIDAKKAELESINNQIKNSSSGLTQEELNALVLRGQTLASELELLINNYNSSVETYNACIAQ